MNKFKMLEKNVQVTLINTKTPTETTDLKSKIA